MKQRRFLCALLTCVAVASCLLTLADATVSPRENVISQEDMEWEWIDGTSVENLEDGIIPLTNNSADGQYPELSICTVTQPIDFKANALVTFNCSYSPSSTSMDFGVIASNGRFYYINVKEGSINQAVRISLAGSYTVAIRNNSSQTVRVVGFVDY